MKKISTFKVIFSCIFLFYIKINANEPVSQKKTLTLEQKLIDEEHYQKSKDKYPHTLFKSGNDSLREQLKLLYEEIDSCIDANCYATKKEFNQLLNSYEIASTNNIDSLRTNILFKLYKNKFLKLKSQEFKDKTQFDKKDCDPEISIYKLKVLTSTDSSLLLKSLDAATSNFTVLTTSNNSVYFSFDNNKHIAELVFKLQDNYIDFEIDQSSLDSGICTAWSAPIKAPFGFYSYYVIDKTICFPNYLDLNNVIHIAKSDETLELKDSLSYMGNEDSLFVKFWSQPAFLMEKKRLEKLDTSNVVSIELTDRQLPVGIRKTVLEAFYRNGSLYFDNYKNDYCLWCLKILNYKKSSEKAALNSTTIYTISQKVIYFLNQIKEKNVEQEDANSRNQYLSYMYIRNSTKHEYNAGGEIPVEVVINTERQINKSVLDWIKENVRFIRITFYPTFLSKTITDN